MVALTPNRAGLGEADRERLLYRWNATRAAVPDLCVHELFERQAAASPEAVAVVHEDRRLSYRELEPRARTSSRIICAGSASAPRRSSASAWSARRSSSSRSSPSKAGGAYVPLDPAYPPERLPSWSATPARMLLTQEKLAGAVPGRRRRPRLARRPIGRRSRAESAERSAPGMCRRTSPM